MLTLERSTLVQLATMTEDALDTDDEAIDPSFDLDSSLRSDLDHQLEREDRVSLGLFLCIQLSKHFDLGDTKVAEIAGIMVRRSDRTVRECMEEAIFGKRRGPRK